MVYKLLAVALGGAIGASLRFGVSVLLTATQPERPWLATLVVNVVGSVLFGCIAGWASTRSPLPELAHAFVLTGCLGALTTFSTFAYDQLHLMESESVGAAFVYLTASVVLGVGLFFAAYYALARVASIG